MSAEPIVSREIVAQRAFQDALAMLIQGLDEVPNPYPLVSAESVLWKVAFQRAIGDLS